MLMRRRLLGALLMLGAIFTGPRLLGLIAAGVVAVIPGEAEAARINLSGSNITFNPINGWEVISFDPDTGAGVVEMQSAGGAQRLRRDFALSNTALRSTGIKVNATYEHWNQRVVSFGPGPASDGMGAANSLTNAASAFENAAGGQMQRLKAVGLRGVTDGWVDALLAGT